MNIVFIITRGDTVGGATIHVRDMSKRLIKEGHQVSVIVGAGEVVPNLLEATGIPVIQFQSMVRSVHPIKDALTILKLTKLFIKLQPDIVSSHTSKAGALARVCCALLNIPVLYTPHCWSFVDNFPKAGMYRFIEQRLRPLATRVVAVSEFERIVGLEQKACSDSKSITIHNGMPLSKGALANTSHTPPRIIMVARFDTQKDHQTLIQALAQLKALEWELTLVGDGPSLAEIEAFVESEALHTRVTFLGYSNQIEDLLAESQIFVLSTKWESFPRSILEAMRAGLPAIATDIGGCKESILDNENGFIVQPEDVSSLTTALEKLITSQSLRVKMGLKSRERYEALFTFDIMYKKYQKLYGEVLKIPNINQTSK